MHETKMYAVAIFDADNGNEVKLFRTEKSADAYLREVTATYLGLDQIPSDVDCQKLLIEEFEGSSHAIPDVDYYLCEIND
ncbi:hypothetical protein ACN2XU_22855 [Primorskyibacter sp. 2E107]|uniref:hypothetical protein n=1 Tax=Primorskyibacter sp. 2E107 TaxID=3403458 RepID=UPI003AF5215E